MEEPERKRTITEEFEIAGNQLVEQIKKLIAEGNVRRIRIKDAEGDIYLETPLTIGTIAGGAVVLAAPWLAVLGVLAALIARVKIEVVREAREGEAKEGEAVEAEKKDAA
jgi:hypothetical protein